MQIREPAVRDEEQILAAHEEMAREGFTFALRLDLLDSYVEWLAATASMARGEQVPPGFVRSSFLIAVEDDVVLGRVSIRHELNAFLTEVGGHVGYGVLRAHRRRGVATAMLRDAVARLGTEGLPEVLVTTDDDNVASAQVIETCGGVLEDVRPNPPGPPKRRYWIPT